jgi:hypothetical protein
MHMSRRLGRYTRYVAVAFLSILQFVLVGSGPLQCASSIAPKFGSPARKGPQGTELHSFAVSPSGRTIIPQVFPPPLSLPDTATAFASSRNVSRRRNGARDSARGSKSRIKIQHGKGRHLPPGWRREKRKSEFKKGGNNCFNYFAPDGKTFKRWPDAWAYYVQTEEEQQPPCVSDAWKLCGVDGCSKLPFFGPADVGAIRCLNHSFAGDVVYDVAAAAAAAAAAAQIRAAARVHNNKTKSRLADCSPANTNTPAAAAKCSLLAAARKLDSYAAEVRSRREGGCHDLGGALLSLRPAKKEVKRCTICEAAGLLTYADVC